MKHEEFCLLIDGYFDALIRIPPGRIVTMQQRQTRIDEARLKIVDAFMAEHADAERWRWWRENGDEDYLLTSAPERFDKLIDEELNKVPAHPVPTGGATPLACGCSFSDTWRCAVQKNLNTLTCQCSCHRPGSGLPVVKR